MRSSVHAADEICTAHILIRTSTLGTVCGAQQRQAEAGEEIVFGSPELQLWRVNEGGRTLVLEACLQSAATADVSGGAGSCADATRAGDALSKKDPIRTDDTGGPIAGGVQQTGGDGSGISVNKNARSAVSPEDCVLGDGPSALVQVAYPISIFVFISIPYRTPFVFLRVLLVKVAYTLCPFPS